MKGFIVSVEDNPNDCALMKRIFEREMPLVKTHIIEDSLTALAWFKDIKNTPDLILLDIKMPKLDRLSLLKEIRKIELFTNSPIVIMSSSDQLSDRDKAYAYGANSYLEKPKSYTELKEILPVISNYWLTLNK
jgi:two-component system response regulator